MLCAREVIAAVLLITAVGNAQEAACPHADKIKPVNVDITEISRKRLKVLYATENNFSVTLDSAYIDITPNVVSDDPFRAVSTTTTKENVSKNKTYTFTYKDGVMSYNRPAGPEGQASVRTYILAHAPKENAILYYRCKPGSTDSDVDLRFISLPDGNELSDESLNKLLEVDRSISFKGKLFRLPYQL